MIFTKKRVFILKFLIRLMFILIYGCDFVYSIKWPVKWHAVQSTQLTEKKGETQKKKKKKSWRKSRSSVGKVKWNGHRQRKIIEDSRGTLTRFYLYLNVKSLERSYVVYGFLASKYKCVNFALEKPPVNVRKRLQLHKFTPLEVTNWKTLCVYTYIHTNSEVSIILREECW